MNEQEIRALVRRVLAERESWGSARVDAWGPPPQAPSAGSNPIRQHFSHARFVIPAQGDACVIETGVACNHCGYCKSYGH